MTDTSDVTTGSLRRWVIRIVRVVLGLAVLGLCVLMIVQSAGARTTEAFLTRPIVGLLTPGSTSSYGSVVFFGLGTPHAAGLRITVECTVLVMLIPIAIAVGALLMCSRIPVGRLLAGGVAGAAVAILVNQIRVALIAFSIEKWGMDPGYEISHKFVGSVLGIVGFVLSFLVLVKLMGGRGPRRAN